MAVALQCRQQAFAEARRARLHPQPKPRRRPRQRLDTPVISVRFLDLESFVDQRLQHRLEHQAVRLMPERDVDGILDLAHDRLRRRLSFERPRIETAAAYREQQPCPEVAELWLHGFLVCDRIPERLWRAVLCHNNTTAARRVSSARLGGEFSARPTKDVEEARE